MISRCGEGIFGIIKGVIYINLTVPEINRDGTDTPIGSMVNDEFAILTEMSHEVEHASVKLNNDNELEFEYKQT